jgi:hypothetical protein
MFVLFSVLKNAQTVHPEIVLAEILAELDSIRYEDNGIKYREYRALFYKGH